MAWTNRGLWCAVVMAASVQAEAQTQTPPASAPVIAPVASAPATTPPESAPAASAPLSGINLGEFDTTKPGQLKWENNPFVKTTESLGVQDMHLMAIVYRPGNAAALINGRVMKKGDRLGDNEVVHVEAKRVVMRNADGIFSLTMSGASR